MMMVLKIYVSSLNLILMWTRIVLCSLEEAISWILTLLSLRLICR